MSVRIGVVLFPGSNRDIDAVNALEVAGAEPVVLWHDDTSLDDVAGVLIPGGFAYGDYLRAGVIARFSPIMRAVSAFAEDGGLVLGICNGFQVLTEAHLLPGALLRNRDLRFVSREISIAAERFDTPFTHALADRPLRMPVAHGEGAFYADEATLDELEANGQILFRYVHDDGSRAGGEEDRANPNGSLRAIAGVMNAAGNVAGLMPHPETAVEAVLGSSDGLGILASFISSAARTAANNGALAGGVAGRW
jgi:phosphoribosylformylglycinamidine synthase subunit PurQ / glutaminase